MSNNVHEVGRAEIQRQFKKQKCASPNNYTDYGASLKQGDKDAIHNVGKSELIKNKLLMSPLQFLRLLGLKPDMKAYREFCRTGRLIVPDNPGSDSLNT